MCLGFLAKCGAKIRENQGALMIKKTIVAVALSALACAAWTSSASAKHHAKHPLHAPVTQAPTAETIPGVNPMTNAGAIPPVQQPATYAPIQGVNPMTNTPAIH
jgi:hypothetical protein